MTLVKRVVTSVFVFVVALALVVYLFQPYLHCQIENACFGQPERCSHYDEYGASCVFFVTVPFID
jgi:hypothetical protein